MMTSSVTLFIEKRKLLCKAKYQLQSECPNSDCLNNSFKLKNRFLLKILVHISLYRFQPIRDLRLLTRVGFLSKPGSDTFRSILIYGKEQESSKKICHNRRNTFFVHVPNFWECHCRRTGVAVITLSNSLILAG